ncbi:MAG: phage portal protein [Deltaproteobacteria bacterium]|nr:phage portal protein [Deltaproteobacteria bacterium]
MATRGGRLFQVFEDARSIARTLLASGLVPSSLEPMARKFSGAGGYDAAKKTRSRADWTRTNVGPNTEVAAAGSALRARTRDVFRNNPYAARAVNVTARGIVGTGILARAVDDDGKRTNSRLQRQANAAWKAWGKRGVADNEGQHTLDALTWLIVVAWLRDGEIFIRRLWDPTASPPVRVQLLEADMLDEGRTHPAPGGGRIIQGIELDRTGRRAAYWFRESHPGESVLGASSYESVRVAAHDVIHLFLPLRAGQLRGLPFLTPALVTIYDLGKYEGEELIRKRTETLVAAFLTPPAIESAFPALQVDSEGKEIAMVPSAINAAGDMVGDMQPGAVIRLENGADVRFNSPVISGNYDSYKASMLRGIAVAMDMAYPDLSGDLTGVNWTSYRVGSNAHNAHLAGMQWLHLLPVVMDTLWAWCQEAAYLAGLVSRPIVPVAWTPPVRASHDPEKEALANILLERAGYKLHDDIVSEYGNDPAEFLEAKKAEKKAYDEAGITLDTQPHKMAFRGAFASGLEGTALADEVATAKKPPAADGSQASEESA